MTNIKNDKLPWIEKYRPKNFTDVIDHKEKINTLTNLIKNNELCNLIFYGPSGTGKTSLILAIAREIYGNTEYKNYILEINASDDRGIETVRITINNFVKSKCDKVKLVILDECDSMTYDSQRALTLMIEKSAKTTRFCLICNNINKIVGPIQSRCVKMRFSNLNPAEIKKKIIQIVSLENINITDEAIDVLISLEKDFRQILNILQGIYNGNNKYQITSDDIYSYIGKPSTECINKVYKTLFTDTFDNGCKILLDMYRSNEWNVEDLIGYLLIKILNVNINVKQKTFLIEKLAEIEFRIKMGRETETQLIYLVSCFQLARQNMNS